jgi:hypothetical protein
MRHAQDAGLIGHHSASNLQESGTPLRRIQHSHSRPTAVIRVTSGRVKGLILAIVLSVVCAVAVAVASISNPHFGGRRNLLGHASDEFTLSQSPPKTSIECKVIQFDTLFESENGFMRTEEHLACIPFVDGVLQRNTEHILELPDSLYNASEQAIRKGQFYLTISNAYIARNQVVWSDSSTFEVTDREERHLAQKTVTVGTRSVAVIKINTIDSSMNASVSEMNEILFGPNSTNFVSQYSACSFGQLKWTTTVGVMEVNLAESIHSFTSATDVVMAAQAQLAKDMPGLTSAADLADSVMFCVPPGTGTWIANAGVNFWRANFNGDWCLSLSATMHEVCAY